MLSPALCYRPVRTPCGDGTALNFAAFRDRYRARVLYGGRKVQFVFADHTLDIERRELRRGSESVAVEPQVLDLLICLVQNRNRVVTKDDLIASVWGGRIVSEATLTSRIYAARKAVGDSGHGQKLIRTIARKGLRFVGDVRAEPNGAEPALATDPPLLDELREPSRLTLPLPERPVIAVLPFLNMCADPAQDYFADVITEGLTTALSRIKGAFVIARSTAFTYKGKPVDVKQVGKELDVRYALEGSAQ